MVIITARPAKRGVCELCGRDGSRIILVIRTSKSGAESREMMTVCKICGDDLRSRRDDSDR
jgi:hypothetical protein